MSMFKDAKIPVFREFYNEPNKSLAMKEGVSTDSKEVIDTALLAKANKKIPEIEILKLNSGNIMPGFLLEEEMIEKLKDVVDPESTGRGRSDSRGSLSTWPKEVIHPRVSPDRGGEMMEPFDFEI